MWDVSEFEVEPLVSDDAFVFKLTLCTVHTYTQWLDQQQQLLQPLLQRIGLLVASGRLFFLAVVVIPGCLLLVLLIYLIKQHTTASADAELQATGFQPVLQSGVDLTIWHHCIYRRMALDLSERQAEIGLRRLQW
jgi:hypothetical protein